MHTYKSTNVMTATAVVCIISMLTHARASLGHPRHTRSLVLPRLELLGCHAVLSDHMNNGAPTGEAVAVDGS